MILKTKLARRVYEFRSIKEVMAKANELKSGDVLAGLAAASDSEQVAAKEVLSNLLLSDLRNSPAVAYEEDDVTRMDQDGVDPAAYDRIKNWTVGEFREWLLSYDATEEAIKEIRKGLTAEMIAGVAKLMSNMDLVYAASKMRVESTCNTTASRRGTFSTRLQPNHPTDDMEGITASLFEGLSYGAGDMLIGLNPVNNSSASCGEILRRFDKVKNRWQIPSHICYLRPGPHHHPDGGGAQGRAYGYDLPVHRRVPEGKPGLRLYDGHCPGGPGAFEGAGHRQGAQRDVL